MKKLSVGQRKSLAEFFTNGAVAWFSAGIIAPVFAGKTLSNFVGSIIWGTISTIWFLLIASLLMKGIKS